MKILIAIVLAALSVAVNADWKSFQEFMRTHGRVYTNSDEAVRRYKIFETNVQVIADHNAKNLTWTAAVNRFADLTPEEFAANFNGFKSGNRQALAGNSSSPTALSLLGSDPVPDAWDWTTQGAVTPIKDQGQCGSCWAFSAVGSLEGAHFRKTGTLLALSEQNLVDCVSKSDGCDGCNGGCMDQAFTYIQTSGGIDTEASYPYVSGTGLDYRVCLSFLPMRHKGTVASFEVLPSGDEDALKTAVYRIGPISIALDASQQSFQFYDKGTYNETNCGNTPDKLNHAMTAVGYGTDENGQFWLMKNSWGTDWGLKGFIKMVRNAKNRCGIATEASYPIITSKM